MRIEEDIQHAGFFWLPSAPQKRIPGTLRIADGGEIELETVGLFDERKAWSDEEYELKRIVGCIEKVGPVTLEDCFYRRIQNAWTEIDRSLVHVNKALLGAEYEEFEELLFDSLQFSVEGIDEWVGINGTQVQYDHAARTVTITHRPPDEIVMALSNGLELRIAFSSTLPGAPIFTEAKIQQKTYFRLVSADKRGLNELIHVAHKVTTFLCFAIGRSVSIEHVVASAEDLREDLATTSRPAQIHVYYPSLPFSIEKPKIEWHRMLFRFTQIQGDPARIFESWIAAYDTLGPALSLYLSTVTGAHKFLDSKFLALAQGLETYHRRTSTETVMPSKDFDEVVQKLIEQCPSDKQDWLTGRLTYGNEISLRQRIKRIVEPFKDAFGGKNERRKMIGSITDTRNYLTHFDQSLKTKAASGRDLWNLCGRMEVIFQLQLLQVVGFTADEIRSMLKSSQQLKQKLDG